MYRHTLCGIELRTDLRLTSLALAGPAEPGAPFVTLTCEGASRTEPRRWLYNERDEASAPRRAVGVTEGGYLVRIHGVADFLLEEGGAAARMIAERGVSLDLVEPFFLEQVFPLWWSLLGRPCLHASAVLVREGAAIAFSGRSGSGKSTLAASFASSGEGALLADDCLVLDVAEGSVVAHPSPPSVRLLGDSAAALFASPTAGSLDEGKRRIDLRAAQRPAPLARVYMLEATSGAPRAVALRPRDAVARLARSFFRMDPEDRSRLAEELDLLERIAARAPVVALEVPRRYDALEEVRRVIAADLAAGGAT